MSGHRCISLQVQLRHNSRASQVFVFMPNFQLLLASGDTLLHHIIASNAKSELATNLCYCMQTSSPAPARALSQAKSHVNTPPQPGQPPSRKWAGAAADITKFVTQPGEESANASVMAAALNSILEFPEDLDGPDQMSLMSVIDPAEFQAKKDFNGLVAPNSRMFRAPGRYNPHAHAFTFTFTCTCICVHMHSRVCMHVHIHVHFVVIMQLLT